MTNPAELAQRAWLADPRYGNLQLSLTDEGIPDRLVEFQSKERDMLPPITDRDPGDETKED